LGCDEIGKQRRTAGFMAQHKCVRDIVWRANRYTRRFGNSVFRTKAMKKNTQARVKSAREHYAWESYGDVTHIGAAEQHARRYPFSYSVIETRWEGHETVFEHEVLKKIDYAISPLRGDE
jgi:hypothetical protein